MPLRSWRRSAKFTDSLISFGTVRPHGCPPDSRAILPAAQGRFAPDEFRSDRPLIARSLGKAYVCGPMHVITEEEMECAMFVAMRSMNLKYHADIS